MSEPSVLGYKRLSGEKLLEAIDSCTSLSQLFALIQLEGIVLQMHSQSGASNLKPRTLSPNQVIASNKDTPLDRLKAQVREAVRKRVTIDKINETTTLNELFRLIQDEGIVLQMHSQPGASNLTPRRLSKKEMRDKKDTPFDRLKAEVIRSVNQAP